MQKYYKSKFINWWIKDRNIPCPIMLEAVNIGRWRGQKDISWKKKTRKKETRYLASSSRRGIDGTWKTYASIFIYRKMKEMHIKNYKIFITMNIHPNARKPS